ncbi:MAG: hypothetical protein IPO60_00135 [Flavobacteriales bacterium]|nr:hypothetical protein [Flavobacteriales bacterium]
MERDGNPFVVPVVVHIMEAGNALTQITDKEVREAIMILNQRFRKVPGTIGDGSGRTSAWNSPWRRATRRAIAPAASPVPT